MKIGIIYIKSNEKDAFTLEEILTEQRVSIIINCLQLKQKDHWLGEIDKAFNDYDTILHIVSSDFISKYIDLDSYLSSVLSFQNNKLNFIPLFFFDISNKKQIRYLDNIKFVDFSKDYNNGLIEIIDILKVGNYIDIGKDIQPDTARNFLAGVTSSKSLNPFRLVRAEFFRNDKILAKAFAEPSSERYDIIKEARSVIIFGGRGSGKTMLLKSLTPEIIFYRNNLKNFSEAKKIGFNFFGVYFRLNVGSLLIFENITILEIGFIQSKTEKKPEEFTRLLNLLYKTKDLPFDLIKKEPIIQEGYNAIWAITLNELNFKILKTILLKLASLKSENKLRYTDDNESKICDKILIKLGIDNKEINNFSKLSRFIDLELSKISKYIQDISIPFSTPKSDWKRTSITFLDEILPIINSNINELNDVTFYFLFDELENLKPIQQTIILEWLKTSKNFILKIASKFECLYTKYTLQGQKIQYGQDCPDPINLDYPLIGKNKEKREYQSLLVEICNNLLEISGYKNKLPDLLDTPKEPEVSQYEINKRIEKRRLDNEQDFDINNLDKYRTHMEMAIIFQILREQKNRRKQYSGFETFIYLSSGIIRIFLNLIGMALYKAEASGANIKEGSKISVDDQTWAAYTVSKVFLEKIPDNCDFEEYGEAIYQFIVDVGSILREKLLYHPTEPECLSITLIDKDSLDKPENNIVKLILEYAIRESIISHRKQTSSYKPKSSLETNYKEYMLNRIFSPILELSYRARWGRNKISTHEIKGLLNDKERKRIIKKLKSQIKKEIPTTLDEFM